MMVYYLTSANFALSNIALKRVKISRLIDLNDPFELLGPDISARETRKKFTLLRKEINENYGVICFSKSWENPVLWSHYGDKHRGICLGIDIPNSSLNEITYIGERYEFEFKKTEYKKLLLTKYKAWQYENELRKIINIKKNIHLQSEDGLYFFPLVGKYELKEVILGPRCAIEPSSMNNLVTQLYSDVEIIVSRLAFSSYKVVKDKSKTGRIKNTPDSRPRPTTSSTQS